MKPRGLLRKLWNVGAMLLSRDIAVITNAIAFNFLLCLFPLLLVVAAASQQLPGGQKALPALVLILQELIPFEHKTLADALRSLGRLARQLEVFSLVLIVWGSSGIFMPGVEMALNRAWGGRPRTFVHSRVLAFLMTTAGGLLVFLSVALTSLARSYGREWPVLANYGAKAVAFGLTCLVSS